jgi:hypothetical protein
VALRKALFSSGGMNEAELRDEIAATLKFRDAGELRAEISDQLSHLTQKAGALLAAQAIFLVVDTWGMDHNWPRAAVLVSIASLVVAALIVLTLLRSIYLPSPRVEDETVFAFEDIFKTGRVMGSRAARFNVALYLTFLSVFLLGVSALVAPFA